MTAASIDQCKPQVRTLREADLPQALALSQALAWPYRLEDWQFALRLGRGIAVELDGMLAGTALWWPYGDDFASAGMIIVASAAQRRGIGAALMDELLRQAAGRTIVLNSTAEGLALYARLGFVADGAIHQHQAVLERAPKFDDHYEIHDFVPDDRDTLLELDWQACGMPRSALTDALFAVGVVRTVKRDGVVTGYGCVRMWGRGAVVGPIVASDIDTARALIADLAARHEGGFVRIDVTLASNLSSWLEGIGLPQVGKVTCMALGTAPRPTRGMTLFALSNQSLG